MRPLRLELEGFASFRERTEIDFDGADLFVLSGPMGAGKSSIIDAIGFALYGSVVRYDNANLVAPLISQGLNQARVRLDFRLGDVEYTAVRVVRRSQTGQVNTEGRLQRGEEVVAGAAKDVTDEVTRILGLTFQQFTKCVVLPQGDFADLLHAKPAERQDLLVRLLDLEMYRNIGIRARERNGRAEATVRALQGRLDTDLRDATDAAYRAAETRLSRLETLAVALAANESSLQALRATAAEAAAAAESGEQRAAALAVIVPPAGIGDLDAQLRLARESLKTAQIDCDEAVTAAEQAQAARSLLPERAAIDFVIAAYAELEMHRKLAADLELKLDAASGVLKQAAEGLEEAQQKQTDAANQYERLLQSDAAYHASQGLKAGDVCPVCGETLTAAPIAVAPQGLEAARKALDTARKTLSVVTQAADAARTTQDRQERALAAEREQLKKLEASLEGQPSLTDYEAALKAVAAAESAVLAANSCLQLAREKLRVSQAEVANIDQDERDAWASFSAARDAAVKAGAKPPATPDSIEAAWRCLHNCATDAASQARDEAELHRVTMAGAVRQETAILAEQAQKCAGEGVAVNANGPRDAVNGAKGSAEQELRQIDAKLAERSIVETELADGVAIKSVAGTLQLHLQKNRFESWYLQEALGRLVRGATQRLFELSNQQYSLVLDEKGTDFVIVDHNNTDERRPVRTLSGGETFLASLALALALGDEIGSLAANGAARLDALFLDEGFGTLDADTLETVASTLEELGASGHMVGIVTHVPELAERIPVQFRVVKDGRTSRVERIEAR